MQRKEIQNQSEKVFLKAEEPPVESFLQELKRARKVVGPQMLNEVFESVRKLLQNSRLTNQLRKYGLDKRKEMLCELNPAVFDPDTLDLRSRLRSTIFDAIFTEEEQNALDPVFCDMG